MTEVNYKAIEAAMVTRMDAASAAGSLGFRLRKTGSYAGEFSDLAKAARSFPSAFATFQREAPVERLGRYAWKMRGLFGIVVAAKLLSGETSGRHGRGIDPGSYDLALACEALLVGHTLGLLSEPISPAGTFALYNDEDRSGFASVYQVNVHAFYVRTFVQQPGALDDFETFHANWDIPPIGEVGPALPDDGNADATDHVTLETSDA